MMTSFFDPLRGVLSKHALTVHLGASPATSTAESQTDALRSDLERARQSGIARFRLVLGVLTATFLVTLATAAYLGPSISPAWLAGFIGLFGGGFGTCLLQLSRSAWRTDTLLIVVKYASPAEMKVIMNSLLAAEVGAGRPGARARSTAQP